MSIEFSFGDLVSSKVNEFKGIGKVVSVDENHRATVAFFTSPLEPRSSQLVCECDRLVVAALFDEQVVFVLDEETSYWRRARYGGGRPDNEHLVIFKAGEQIVIGISEIYVLNAFDREFPDPLSFLKARSTDTPHFSEWRLPFIQSYIEQRAACRSITSIPSSSIELEHHQLAVVRRVLQDEKKKYLLADEVGLGKTIEAGLVLRELLLQGDDLRTAVVGVPDSLMPQWHEELTYRFHLQELFESRLFVVPHNKLAAELNEISPEIIIIDEAHQVSPWAWSSDQALNVQYSEIARSCDDAEACLLLSGTPLIGNEINFLSMLHLLSPARYSLSDRGIEEFRKKVEGRERIGGIYQALTADNDNATLSDLVGQLSTLFPDDAGISTLIENLSPHIDWLAEEIGEERASSLGDLRHYLGENFKLHQRMLRNRRDDQGVKHLFPGLAGSSVCTYDIPGEAYCVEQSLELARAPDKRFDEHAVQIPTGEYESWVEAALISPLLVANKAIVHLDALGVDLTEIEQSYFESLAVLGLREKAEKNKKLIDLLEGYWSEFPDAGIVIFCSACRIADDVFKCLQSRFHDNIERHDYGRQPQFCNQSAGKALVCDEKAEDGLNLNGGRKLVVHYSLPFSLPRYEQRLGRVNRYSAGINARRVESVLLIPESSVYSHPWVNLLTEGIGIFEESVASLQYVLEDLVKDAWTSVPESGAAALLELRDRLLGEQGVIKKERQRVRAQEELNRMDEDIRLAAEFADKLAEADEKAEQHSNMMLDWITQGLRFVKKPGELPNTVRFKYSIGAENRGRTLMDVGSFIRQCVTGIDIEESDFSSPVTAMMSPDREIASHGKSIFPMRVGQPFVDVIYHALRSDPRGICSALIRYVRGVKIEQPTSFLAMYWLLSKSAEDDSLEQRKRLDEDFPPQIFGVWISQDGKQICNERILEILNYPYRKKDGGRYQDKNIGPSLWVELEDYLPALYWKDLIEKMTKGGEETLHKHIREGIKTEVIATPIVAKFVLLTGMS